MSNSECTSFRFFFSTTKITFSHKTVTKFKIQNTMFVLFPGVSGAAGLGRSYSQHKPRYQPKANKPIKLRFSSNLILEKIPAGKDCKC